MSHTALVLIAFILLNLLVLIKSWEKNILFMLQLSNIYIWLFPNIQDDHLSKHYVTDGNKLKIACCFWCGRRNGHMNDLHLMTIRKCFWQVCLLNLACSSHDCIALNSTFLATALNLPTEGNYFHARHYKPSRQVFIILSCQLERFIQVEYSKIWL